MENKFGRSLTLLVGHRGVGKTSLLARLKKYHTDLCKEAHFFDLDQYVVGLAGQSIRDIFITEGEEAFRNYERLGLQNILSKNMAAPIFIALGAGYQGPYPPDCTIVFVKRASDQKGRVFLDRPRLKKNVNALSEYKNLYHEREKHYQSICTRALTLQEGKKTNNNHYEKVFFSLCAEANLGGCFTLQKSDWQKGGKKFLQERLDWGGNFIEIRSDYWTQSEINEITSCIPPEKILWSQREAKNTLELPVTTDWALELGEPEVAHEILSLHKVKNNLADTFSYIESFKDKHLKLALPVDTFEALASGHQWYLKAPHHRSFLPMSEEGRWSWYRLWHKNKMFPNFYKESKKGSANDQPFFYEWCNYQFDESPKYFAAILGSPVSHSWTPNEQFSFFKKYNMPVLTIAMKEEECTAESLEFLKKLGLRAAAVTSPLKNKMKELVGDKNFASINTICFSQKSESWQSTNTDIDGLVALLHSYQGRSGIVLWGGGGVVPSVCEVLPAVSAYSARKSSPRSRFKAVASPNVVIWAVGRSRQENWPDNKWQPQVIVDLNYSEDSPGREYALKVGAKYISGKEMFYKQAQKQREFWTQHLQNPIA